MLKGALEIGWRLVVKRMIRICISSYNMVHQLTIFDALPMVKEFGINDVVEIVATTDRMDVETYYYLQEFAGLKCRVIKVNHVPDLQYEVVYAKKERVGIFRHGELERR